MNFPTSISFTREIHLHIKSQDINDILDLIEQECLQHGTFDFTRENNKLTFVKTSNKGRRKGSDRFKSVDYGTVEIDIYLHTLKYDFYVVKSALSHAIIGVLIILLAVVQKNHFPTWELIVVGFFALNIFIIVHQLKGFATNMTNEVNWMLERDDEDSDDW